jgi:hypothetical protein
VGAKFRWPCFTKEITDEGLVLTTGELIPADTVVFSIGDQPDLDFLPPAIATNRGYVVVNDQGQTSESKVFAIGDIVRPGLLTDAIGAGRRAALAIGDMLAGRRPTRTPGRPSPTRASSWNFRSAPALLLGHGTVRLGMLLLRLLPGLRHVRGHLSARGHLPQGP